MKILLDHNLDRRLKSLLPEHEIETTQENGWADVVNGKLLTLAEENGFSVLLTADVNIRKQQNLTGRTISILVLRAFNNRLVTHKEMITDVNEALSRIGAAEIIEVIHPDLDEKLRKNN